MKRSTFFTTAIATLIVALTATLPTGCEYQDNFHKTDREGRLIEISGKIGTVYARKSTPEPGDSPQQYYRLRFDQLDPGDYTIRMRVEKFPGDATTGFDVAQAKITSKGYFKLTMPRTIDPAWLGKVPDELEVLWEEGGYYPIALDGLPDEVEISNPGVDMCIAVLYMERAADGQRYDVAYGGPDKETLHGVTDLSSVSSSSLLYTSDRVRVAGWVDNWREQTVDHYNRAFDIESTGGWNWLHCITNGMSGYIGWDTAWPEWAVMSYSASAIYED